MLLANFVDCLGWWLVVLLAPLWFVYMNGGGAKVNRLMVWWSPSFCGGEGDTRKIVECMHQCFLQFASVLSTVWIA